MEPVIRFEGVRKSYHGHVLFEDVNLAIEPGLSYGLRGPNGSGKSVLMRLMCRFTLPDAGNVTIAREYLNDRRTFPERFGVAIDGPAYVGHRTGFENLMDLASITGRAGEAEVSATMQSLGLDPANRTPVNRYSMGMKQKLSITQTIMESQEVLILDEPFNALDVSSVETLSSLLLDLKEQGRTIVLTSHEATHLDLLADRIITIDAQRVTVGAG